MATFTLHSDITIGSFRFSGVHSVVIKKSIHSYVETAVIQLPSIARVKYKNSTSLPRMVTTGELFKDGDPVTINLGYNGQMKEEFRGFVRRRDLSFPLSVECEGYSYLLRKKTNINKVFQPSTSVSEVLTEAVKDTGIKLIVHDDMPLSKVTLQNCSAAQALDYVIKECSQKALNAFFISPDTLWVGIMYLPYSDGVQDATAQGQVNYFLGYNVVKDNNLKERTPVDVVIHYYKNQKTKRQRGAGPALKPLSTVIQKVINTVPQATWLKLMANINDLRANYTGYEGKISAFLQPFALPGYKAYIKDSRYQERNGTYMIEGIEVTFGVNGARRNIEIGPKIYAP